MKRNKKWNWKRYSCFIFKKIKTFYEYGFNKSHATAYALIAYQTAFLKDTIPKIL